MYLLVGIAISILVSDVADHFLRLAVYKIALLDTGPAVSTAFAKALAELWFWRWVKLFLLVITAYFLTLYALRPIKKSAELQKRFAATVSHELKTPITVMRNSIEVALRHKENLTLQKAISVLESNQEEVKYLSDMVEFITTFSRLKDRRNLFPRSKISLLVVIEQVVHSLQSNEKNGVIIMDVPGDAFIFGNETGIYVLVTNLIKNALAHSPSEGVISVRVVEDSLTVTLSVSDTGQGISSEDMPYIFVPFYSGYNGRKNITGDGLGLGLSIAKEIAKLHHASISAKNNPKGGATLQVVFKKI